MERKPIDLTEIITRRHENKWVALTTDKKRVVASSENLVTLMKKIGKREVIYMKVPVSGISYAF